MKKQNEVERLAEIERQRWAGRLIVMVIVMARVIVIVIDIWSYS